MIAETKTEIAYRSEARAAKRGFTLTEIAIVLGIIGLILGAIWVAATAVYNNMRLSSSNTALLQITQAVRSMYATSLTVDPLAIMLMNGANSGAGLTYIRAGVFPTSTLDTGTPSTAVQVYDSWQGNISINPATNLSANDSFSVAFDQLPSQACISLLTASTGTGRDPGMFAVGGGVAGTLPAQTALQPGQPFPSHTAEAQCDNGTNNNAAAFWFTLRAN